jgi:hypothetical protein
MNKEKRNAKASDPIDVEEGVSFKTKKLDCVVEQNQRNSQRTKHVQVVRIFAHLGLIIICHRIINGDKDSRPAKFAVLPGKPIEHTTPAAHRTAAAPKLKTRLILAEDVVPKTRLNIGSELAAIGRRYGAIELNVKRDPRPAEPADFSQLFSARMRNQSR